MSRVSNEFCCFFLIDITTSADDPEDGAAAPKDLEILTKGAAEALKSALGADLATTADIHLR